MSEHSQESFIATPFKLRHDCPRSRENRGKTGNVSGLYNSISEQALWSSARVGSSIPRSLPSNGLHGSYRVTPGLRTNRKQSSYFLFADDPSGTSRDFDLGPDWMSASPCSRHLTLTGDRLRHVQDCQSGYTSVRRPFQAVERLDALAQLPALHKPFGVQSCTTVVGICDD
jgi:hypothetical protein